MSGFRLQEGDTVGYVEANFTSGRYGVPVTLLGDILKPEA